MRSISISSDHLAGCRRSEIEAASYSTCCDDNDDEDEDDEEEEAKEAKEERAGGKIRRKEKAMSA
jgi:hypothetical protein